MVGIPVGMIKLLFIVIFHFLLSFPRFILWFRSTGTNSESNYQCENEDFSHINQRFTNRTKLSDYYYIKNKIITTVEKQVLG